MLLIMLCVRTGIRIAQNGLGPYVVATNGAGQKSTLVTALLQRLQRAQRDRTPGPLWSGAGLALGKSLCCFPAGVHLSASVDIPPPNHQHPGLFLRVAALSVLWGGDHGTVLAEPRGACSVARK